jgi:hypothetical protein
VKNKPDYWKNIAAQAWKPASKVRCQADPDSITSHTRLRYTQNVVQENNLSKDSLNIGTICSVESEQANN